MGIEVCHFVPTLLGLLHSIWILSPSNFKSTNRFVYVKLDKRCESTGISSISNWQIWMYNLLNLNHIPVVLWRVSREDLGLPTSCLSKLAFPWVKHHVQSLEKQVLWLEFCSTGTVEFLEIFPPAQWLSPPQYFHLPRAVPLPLCPDPQRSRWPPAFVLWNAWTSCWLGLVQGVFSSVTKSVMKLSDARPEYKYCFSDLQNKYSLLDYMVICIASRTCLLVWKFTVWGNCLLAFFLWV